MPTDRLFRFSVPGMMFLIAYMFFNYFFEGAIWGLGKENRDLVIASIVFIFSTPVIGLTISTIAYGFLFAIFHYEIIYYVPRDIRIIDLILSQNTMLDEDKNLRDEIIKNYETDWTKKLKRRFYPYYQSKVREFISENAKYEFLERRWSTFWTNINCISSIVFSFLVNISLITFDDFHRDFTFSWYKLSGLILILVYIYFSFTSLWRARNEALKVEHILLLNELMKNEKI